MRRTIPTSLLMYAGVLGTAAAAIALSAHTIVTTAAALSPPNQGAKTVLDMQIESARAIREALNRPQPAVEPLPPITAKAAHATPSMASAVAEAPPSRPRSVRISNEARNAFALSTPWAATASAPTYPVADRHTSNY